MTQAGGLRIPQSPGVGSKTEHEIHNIWNTFDDVELQLAKAGLDPLDKPNYSRPYLIPGVLEKATGGQITELYVKYGAWYSYAVNYLARVTSKYVQVKNEMTILAINLRKGAAEAANRTGLKKPIAKDIEDNIKLDPGYQKLMIEEQELNQTMKLLESHAESLKRELGIVSRQVEIRRQELELNTGGRGYARPGTL